MNTKIDPFTVTPGLAGDPYIESGIANEIIANLRSDTSEKHVYRITGIRGSGKSVELGKVIQTLKADKNWRVYMLSAKGKALSTLISKMSREKFAEQRKVETSLSASTAAEGDLLMIKGKGEVEITKKIGDREIYMDEEAMLEDFIERANNKKIRILIGIDDISMTPEMVKLLSIIGTLILEGLDVYLVVSGLSENIEEFSTDKSLSFFKRGNTKCMPALNRYDIVTNYEKFLKVDGDVAKKLYDLTLGYAYAYQELGSLYFNKKEYETIDDLMPDYENALFKNSYDLIRTDLSDADKDFIRAFYASGTGKALDIKAHMEKPSGYDVYRSRLINKHIFSDERRGYLSARLPLFDKFFRLWCEE